MATENLKTSSLGNMRYQELGHPVFEVEVDATNVQQSGFDSDAAYTATSRVFSGAQSLKFEMEEESNKKYKQLRLSHQVQQCLYLSVPENSSPLGLILRKTPSFLDLVETKLSHDYSCSATRKRKSVDDDASSTHLINGKMKASNFSASSLNIGSWERISKHDGDLVAKCYFAKRKFLWELLDGGLKNKIEIMWSDIASIRATCKDNGPQTLEIELLRRPLFYRETNPQPRKHTLWKATADFTAGQASIFRRHKLQFPQGTLQKHYDRLLKLDNGLSLLSKNPFPSLESPFFGPDDLESQNPNDFMLFGLEGQGSSLLKRMFEWGTNADQSEKLPCFTLTGTSVPLPYSSSDHAFTSPEASSSSSGASRSCMGQGTPTSNSNLVPGVFPSLKASLPNYTTLSSDGRISRKATAQVLGKNLGLAVNSNSNWHHTSDCWISDTQTDKNLTSSFEGGSIMHKSDLDQVYDEFSHFEEMNGDLHPEDMPSSCAELFANICTFPVVILEDEAAINILEDEAAINEAKAKESMEWMPWA
ncbi:hypothetical protein C5167_035239 [Papaver somniferum]|uniref:TRF2/HOY1 PH-like domain-containing protein n=1 Tax=Papaver somniferum TaxID=3469 RepID=A0A4Y7KGW5_PAPSO|nr:uncharacterized protein LOC113300144 [Papaver somniferum]XP_026405128.1 uncharacterized protein LOC113300144 [Papaver somniferum]RZC72086.1 hypothetical protein C5167_035239 [Papaver somniferum]